MKKMKQDNLIREIVSFCLDYGVLIDRKEIERKIKQGLEKAELIEDLYNTIFRRAKSDRGMDIKRVIELLIELERVRLELEFKDHL